MAPVLTSVSSLSPLQCYGDSDETDVKTGAITAQQGGLIMEVMQFAVFTTLDR